MNERNFYTYKATVTDVYDGDSITVNIDLGFWIIMHEQKIRLYGINAPEIKGIDREKGLQSKEWLKNKILGKTIILQTIKDKSEKYGRLLGVIYLPEISINEGIETTIYTNINELMVKQGLADLYIL